MSFLNWEGKPIYSAPLRGGTQPSVRHPRGQTHLQVAEVPAVSGSLQRPAGRLASNAWMCRDRGVEGDLFLLLLGAHTLHPHRPGALSPEKASFFHFQSFLSSRPGQHPIQEVILSSLPPHASPSFAFAAVIPSAFNPPRCPSEAAYFLQAPAQNASSQAWGSLTSECLCLYHVLCHPRWHLIILLFFLSEDIWKTLRGGAMLIFSVPSPSQALNEEHPEHRVRVSLSTWGSQSLSFAPRYPSDGPVPGLASISGKRLGVQVQGCQMNES